MGALSPTHWAIIAVLVVLLFGSKRLPDTARGLGQSLRILRAETRAMDEPAPGGREGPGTTTPEPAVGEARVVQGRGSGSGAPT
jgi:sec-independent protein translocase protein TatA